MYILYLSHSSVVLKKVMSTDDDVQDMYVHIWYVVYYNIIQLCCIDIFILVYDWNNNVSQYLSSEM